MASPLQACIRRFKLGVDVERQGSNTNQNPTKKNNDNKTSSSRLQPRHDRRGSWFWWCCTRHKRCSGPCPTVLFDSVAIVQQGFGGTGIEGQDITLHTAIVLVDPHGLIPMDCQRATTERLIAGSTQSICRPHDKVKLLYWRKYRTHVGVTNSKGAWAIEGPDPTA